MLRPEQVNVQMIDAARRRWTRCRCGALATVGVLRSEERACDGCRAKRDASAEWYDLPGAAVIRAGLVTGGDAE